MAGPDAVERASVPPVNDTLRLVVVGFRLLSWLWIIAQVTTILVGDKPGNRVTLIATVALATVWTGVTLWAARSHDRLGTTWFAIADGVVALMIAFSGYVAGADHIIGGGWPNSWIFVVAYAANLRWTMLAAISLVIEHTALHLLHGFDAVQTVGTFQFIVFGLVAGWTFDALREREALRIQAETALAATQREMARHEERLQLARHLHDSYLQTLVSTRNAADDPDEVRYLTRRQEREVRRAIEEFRSPYKRSFKADLLKSRDEVEDLFKGVDIVEVIRDDAEVTEPLAAAVSASREAMVNAAKHASESTVDLYAEIADGSATIHVRDRGPGFGGDPLDNRGIVLSIVEPVEKVVGKVEIHSSPGNGTEVVITVPI